jgi:pSer/pThr/pTyr-binding forkhead associated (FHA) protein
MLEATAYLKALTPESRACLGTGLLPISRLPFRVGRESRLGDQQKDPDLRQSGSLPNNDLYLLENGSAVNVSREHFQIELRDGAYYLVDRGSVCGTLVEGITVGKGRSGGEKRLEDGDVIVVGTSTSCHAFKFLIERA